jgi:hypothetical protein
MKYMKNKQKMKGGNNMKKTILVISLTLIALLTISGVYAYQYGKKYNASNIDKEAAEKAIESGDYAAWKAIHSNSNGKMASLINEDNFYLLREMHEAKESGDLTKVNEIKAQLGFKSGKGNGKGKGINGCPM